jgi:hypothetical protein
VPSVDVNEYTDTRSLAHRLTRWFEARLDESIPPRGAVVQLYGLEVIDPDGIDTLQPGAVRAVFICEGPDEFTVLTMPGSGVACDFDAASTVEYAWVPIRTNSSRPGRFARRRRERFVRVDVRQ